MPAHLLSTAAYPAIAGDPSITVESTSPGVRGSVVVGRGIAFQDTLQLAQELGINGTPGFIIGNKLVPGAVDKQQMKELIAEARKRG